MSYTTVTCEQLQRIQPKVLAAFTGEGLDDHQQAVALSIIIMALGKANGATEDELIEGFEEMVYNHFDDIEEIPIS